eukprot:3278165-Pleurochrysis_carterae.AAC.1
MFVHANSAANFSLVCQLDAPSPSPQKFSHTCRRRRRALSLCFLSPSPIPVLTTVFTCMTPPRGFSAFMTFGFYLAEAVLFFDKTTLFASEDAHLFLNLRLLSSHATDA